MGRASKAKASKALVKALINPLTSNTEERAVPQLAPDMFFKRSANEPRIVSDFWIWLSMEFSEMAFKYPNMSAHRALSGENEGEWIIRGSSKGEEAFRDLAILAARKLGCHEGPHGAVQWFLSHLYGDHVEKAPEVIRDPKTIDFLTVDEKGEKEFHMGRYKQSGVDHRIGGEGNEKGKDVPMEVPKPVIPLVNSSGSDKVQ